MTKDVKEFKKQVTAFVMAHPAMQPDSQCVCAPDLPRWNWEELEAEWGSVTAFCKEIEDRFNSWGW